jgi:hypothetical protein
VRPSLRFRVRQLPGLTRRLWGAAGQRFVGATAYDTHIQGLATGMSGWLGDPAVLMLTAKAHEAVQAIEATPEVFARSSAELYQPNSRPGWRTD